MQQVWDWAASYFCDNATSWTVPQKDDVRLGIDRAVEWIGLPFMATGAPQKQHTPVSEHYQRLLSAVIGFGSTISTSVRSVCCIACAVAAASESAAEGIQAATARAACFMLCCKCRQMCMSAMRVWAQGLSTGTLGSCLQHDSFVPLCKTAGPADSCV
jgi:hypothetical protein